MQAVCRTRGETFYPSPVASVKGTGEITAIAGADVKCRLTNIAYFLGSTETWGSRSRAADGCQWCCLRGGVGGLRVDAGGAKLETKRPSSQMDICS